MDFSAKMLRDDALKGKVIVVTGGGSGLGKAMTKYFMELGAKVAITSRDLEKLQNTVKELETETGGTCLAVQCDVRHYEEVENMLKEVLKAYGKVDVLLNNAAGNFISPTERLSANAFDTVLDIVLKGSKNCTLAFGKHWIDTKGNIINLSRQAVINDDLGAFVGLAGTLGRAAARTVETDVYALLALNGGLGPTMSDTKSLFHADHDNVGSGAAISMLSIDADRVILASQLDVGGNDYLDLRPAVLLLPISLGGTARSINEALYDPDTANKLQKPNVVRGLFRDVVDTPRLTGTRRYMFADPVDAPVIEVAFLDGAQEPYLEVQDGFDVDGARYKVRLDFGIAAIDYRGAVTNAGV